MDEISNEKTDAICYQVTDVEVAQREIVLANFYAEDKEKKDKAVSQTGFE